MKKTTKVMALFLLMATSFGAVSMASMEKSKIAYASSDLNLGISTKNFPSLSATVRLKQDEAHKNASLAAIRQIRSDMWDENVPFTGGNSNKSNQKLRDYLKTKGINSKEAYLNSINWSQDLEKIAIQRATEVGLTDAKGHVRADGSDYSAASLPNGARTNAEIIAYNSGAFSPQGAINQWAYMKRSDYNNRSEYQLLIDANGVYNNGNAHLYILLDPSYQYFGLALVPGADYYYALAEFGNSAKSGTGATGLVGDYTVNFGKQVPAKVTKNKKSKAEIKKDLEAAINKNRETLSAAKYLIKNTPNTVAKVRGELDKLMETSEQLIQKGEKLLQNL